MEKLLVGNWKMNISKEEGLMLATRLNSFVAETRILEDRVTVSIAPPAPILSEIGNIISKNKIKLASQDCSAKENGAYTGEMSAKLLKECGCEYVILGHSERRKYHAENSELVSEKSMIAHKYGLTPIICIGETANEREQGVALEVLDCQLSPLLSLPGYVDKKLIIAYEPIWAIGSGRQPNKEQIQEVIACIERMIELKSSINKKNLKILYGGSVTSENCREILQISRVGGLLIGGASLTYNEFIRILEISSEVTKALA